MADREEKIKIDPLLEMIYEIYKEDIRGGKLRADEQFVEKSASKSQTFHQTALIFRE